MAADLDKPTLHHLHLCDRCHARAYVHVILETGVNKDGYQDAGELFLCAHHAREHLPAMKARSNILHLLDETRFLHEHVKDDKHVN